MSFFLKFPSFLFYLLLYLGSTDAINLWKGSLKVQRGFLEGNDNDNRPRQCQTLSGLKVSIFIFIFTVFFSTK